MLKNIELKMEDNPILDQQSQANLRARSSHTDKDGRCEDRYPVQVSKSKEVPSSRKRQDTLKGELLKTEDDRLSFSTSDREAAEEREKGPTTRRSKAFRGWKVKKDTLLL